jgi:hypothetical protein
MDFWDQITLINGAKKIITIKGANCTNILFTNPTSEFMIIGKDDWWMNLYKTYPSFRMFSHVVDDNSVIYNPKIGANDFLNGPFKADINEFKKMIDTFSNNNI